MAITLTEILIILIVILIIFLPKKLPGLVKRFSKSVKDHKKESDISNKNKK